MQHLAMAMGNNTKETIKRNVYDEIYYFYHYLTLLYGKLFGSK